MISVISRLVVYYACTSVTYSLQQDVYRVCESSALGSVIICIVQSDGQLGEGTAVSVELTTVDVGSEAQGIMHSHSH